MSILTNFLLVSLGLHTYKTDTNAFLAAYSNKIPFSTTGKRLHETRVTTNLFLAYQNYTTASSDVPSPIYSSKVSNKPNKINSQTKKQGKITMVGSGPGDPDLLTVSAYKLLTNTSANRLIISDRLVSKEILSLIPSSTEVKIANKHPGCAEAAQEEIYKWAHDGLRANKHVIRLKIGDPFVFGRGGEEVLKFREFGHEPTIIPGVSASLSAPLLANIPITHRGISNQVVMCTGYGRNGTSPDLIQYHKEQTVVFLMAVGRLKSICENMIQMANYPPSTPVAIVEKAGCGQQQRVVVGTLTTIARIAEDLNVVAPSTIIVGECVHVLLPEAVCGLVESVSGYTNVALEED